MQASPAIRVARPATSHHQRNSARHASTEEQNAFLLLSAFLSLNPLASHTSLQYHCCDKSTIIHSRRRSSKNSRPSTPASSFTTFDIFTLYTRSTNTRQRHQSSRASPGSTTCLTNNSPSTPKKNIKYNQPPKSKLLSPPTNNST
jgi:hypothetical protein